MRVLLVGDAGWQGNIRSFFVSLMVSGATSGGFVYGSIAGSLLLAGLFSKTINVLLVLVLAMRSGLEVAEFRAVDGRRVIVRAPRLEDLDDLLGLINSLVNERAEIVVNQAVTREEEAEWLSGVLVRLEKGELVHLVAEVDGRVVGSADLHPGRGSEAHVGSVGVVVKRGFRGLGVGSGLLGCLEDWARIRGLRLLVLSVFASNKGAIRLYKRVGFVERGRVPLKHLSKGRFVDEVVMAKSLV